MREKRVRTNDQIQFDVSTQTKMCRNCDVRKPFEAFTTSKQRSDGRHSVCRECTKLSHKSWRDVNQDAIRNTALKQRYGITAEDYAKILQSQQGKCAICGTSEVGRRGLENLMVDHCHKTDEVRGLLCDYCNKGLGHFRDDHELLIKAARYLYFRD